MNKNEFLGVTALIASMLLWLYFVTVLPNFRGITRDQFGDSTKQVIVTIFTIQVMISLLTADSTYEKAAKVITNT